MIERTVSPDGRATYKINGTIVSFIYPSKGHWYASDADGNDLDGGWRLDTRLEAEHVAAEYARDLARSA
jgi:hypothetical protein